VPARRRASGPRWAKHKTSVPSVKRATKSGPQGQRDPRHDPRIDPRHSGRDQPQRPPPQRDAWPAHQQSRGAPPRQSQGFDPRERNTAFDPRRSPGSPAQQQEPQHHTPQHRLPPQQNFRERDQGQQWHDAPPQRRGPQAAPPAAPDAHRPRAKPVSRYHERDDNDDRMPVEVPGSMRLSKRMSELGISSRREADEWIPKGWVRVDGRVVSELGSRVLPGQQITVDAKAKFVQAQKVTVILNKPIGYVSGQAEDGYEPAVVLIKPAAQWREDHSGTRYLLTHLRGIAPAGRLDIDSVGMLVLTQDGRIAKQLIGEDSEIEKEYLVRVEVPAGGGLSDSDLALLNHGLELDGEPLREAVVEWINNEQLRFVLKEGKKRQIRRMCEAVGLKVVGLKRVRIGGVMLGDLPVGQWRYLRGDESFVPLRPPTSD
jgi:23S rRNA pseudouridine2604 synthase